MKISIPYFVALGTVILAVAFDWRSTRIPNWLTLGPLPFAPIVWSLLALHSHAAPATILGAAAASLAGAGVCALVPLLLFRLSMIGGGDVKLFATLGALLLPHTGLAVELGAFAAAALAVPARFAYRGTLFSTALHSVRTAARSFRRPRDPEPFPPDVLSRIRLTPFVFVSLSLMTLVERLRW